MPTEAIPTTFYVLQDGAQFYFRRSLDEDPKVITYPRRVADHDMHAAKRARDWFISKAVAHGHTLIWET